MNLAGLSMESKAKQVENLQVKGAKEKQLREAARDFEGVLVNTLMNEMQKTVGESGLFENSQTKQIQGMFWQFMSDEVANKGGIGLADQLYREFSRLSGDGSGS